MGEGSPMHTEAGRTVDLAQQPQIDLAKSLHTPADALIVVDRVRRARTCDGGQFIGHQASGASAVKQFAQTKIKTECILCLLEPGFVYVKHAQRLSQHEDYEDRALR